MINLREILTVALLLLVLDGLGQESSKPAIVWSITNLEWSNFKGVPDVSFNTFDNRSAKALSVVGIRFNEIKGDSDCMCYAIEAVFYEDFSWKVTETNSLLEHEQLHFDIMELQARKLRKKALNLLKSEGSANLEHELELVLNEYDKLNDKYDSETFYGTNSKEQLRWKLTVSQALAELESYSVKQKVCFPIEENLD